MTMMKRGSTDPLTLTIHDRDLTDVEWMIVSLKPKEGPTIEIGREGLSVVYEDECSVIAVSLSQEQSLALSEGNVEIDVNWMQNGIRSGPYMAKLRVAGTLLERVV